MSGQPGRRTFLGTEIEERVIEAMRDGMTLRRAAHYAGVDNATILMWQRDARAVLARGGPTTQRERRLVTFLNRAEAARAEAVYRNLLIVQKAATDGDVKAAQWFLERTDPDDWGRRDKVEVTGADGGPVEVNVTARDVLVDRLDAMAGRLAALPSPAVDVDTDEAIEA